MGKEKCLCEQWTRRGTWRKLGDGEIIKNFGLTEDREQGRRGLQLPRQRAPCLSATGGRDRNHNGITRKPQPAWAGMFTRKEIISVLERAGTCLTPPIPPRPMVTIYVEPSASNDPVTEQYFRGGRMTSTACPRGSKGEESPLSKRQEHLPMPPILSTGETRSMSARSSTSSGHNWRQEGQARSSRMMTPLTACSHAWSGEASASPGGRNVSLHCSSRLSAFNSWLPDHVH